MARRSDLDVKYGDHVRAGKRVPCPKCGTCPIWHGVPEFAEHVRACQIIELGQVVGELELAKKPAGWTWDQ